MKKKSDLAIFGLIIDVFLSEPGLIAFETFFLAAPFDSH